MFQKLHKIKLPYYNNDSFFTKARTEIFEYIRSSYRELLKGNVENWECDIFEEEVGYRGWRYTKHHSLYIGFSLNTTLSVESEKKLLTTEFSDVYYSLKQEIMNEFREIIDGVSMSDYYKFHVHLTNAKSKEILLSHIGKLFEVDEYVLHNEGIVYERQ